jgi:hypothetical protein
MPGPGEVIDEYRPLDTEALGKGASMHQLLLLAAMRLLGVEEDGADPARRVVSRGYRALALPARRTVRSATRSRSPDPCRASSRSDALVVRSRRL